ncbi:amino acid permease [Methanorbis rubei]|uniref:Glutamate/gamma-aminobutyrate antiporter n=1 Tax=Methanorbis rubei TaxID=3028300 RepID=A0AAE4MH34_9EURY|nr:putative glutamate/gamma-aminobutyrate antiporter [Methanocorpusculaceae archaeon Cs1]
MADSPSAAGTASGASAKKLSTNKKLGVISLAMINVAAVLSLRNFPTMAMEGWSMIFWYVLFTVCFLIPTALVAAELASTWPKAGGIYAWVKEAYPGDGSFITIWCSWVNNLVWFPTVVSFFAATLAYAILAPYLGDNHLYMAIVMLACFWGVTLFNFVSTARSSTTLSTVGTFFGSLIPIGIIVVLMIVWLALGNPNALGMPTVENMLPSMNMSTVTFAASLVLMFAGMEMAGYHARETENPKRDYPIAMFIAAAIICIMSILGTLAVGVVIPMTDVSLNAGIVQTFLAMFTAFNIEWLIVPVSIMIAIGVIAQLSTWVVGPAKGLQPAAMTGDLPPIFRKVNKHGMPTGVLVVQAIISSIFAIAMIAIPSINQGYWVLTAMTSLINGVMYMFLFAAFIKLRRTKPDVERPYKLPGGKFGMWLVGGVALVTLVFAFVVGLLPETNGAAFGLDETIMYVVSMLVAVLAIILLPPMILRKLKKPSWKPSEEEYKAWLAEDGE